MKTVQLKISVEDNSTEEIIELTFEDNELDLLKLFLKNIQRLETARMLKKGSNAPLMVKKVNIIFVGWVEQSETQH
jgi:hypothetical protein